MELTYDEDEVKEILKQHVEAKYGNKVSSVSLILSHDAEVICQENDEEENSE